jgi:hypothetical protein
MYGTWAADLMFMSDYKGVNSSRSCILTLLELTSRYAYARALTAPTSAKAAVALREILVQNAKDYSSKPNIAPILKLRTDNGSEFAGDFAKLLDEQDIEHDRVEAGTHAQLARLDRFHRTLRMMIGEIFSVRDSHVWYDVLPNLIDNYNARPSRSLALGKQLRRAPEDIGPTEDAEIREHDLAQSRSQ